MPKVYNRHHKDAPIDAVYIGRGTPWGNPFTTLTVTDHRGPEEVTVVGTREEAVRRFEGLVEGNPAFKRQIKDMLKGKDLLCSCAPKLCHGDVLLRIANE